MGIHRDEIKFRARAKGALLRYFEKRRSPRSMLTLVILITGLAGFGISRGLLAFGFTEMRMRYPLAVLGAYGIFLVLVRIWAEIERRNFDAEAARIPEAVQHADEPSGEPYPSRRSGWLDWLDFPSGVDLDEGCLPVLLLGAIIGLIVLLVSAIDTAPILIAEVFIDVALAGLLYRRLKIAATEHWLGTAILKTWPHVLCAALLLWIVGSCLDVMAPDADSMGKAIREISSPRPQSQK